MTKRKKDTVAIVLRVPPALVKRLDHLTSKRNREEGMELSRTQVILGLIHAGLKHSDE